MAKFTLIERESPGDSTFVPPDPPEPALPLQRNPGEQLLIINRVLVNRKGRRRATFFVRGRIIQTFPPTDDAVMAFEGTNNLEKGVINTQGVIRFGDVVTTGLFRHCRRDPQVQESSRQGDVKFVECPRGAPRGPTIATDRHQVGEMSGTAEPQTKRLATAPLDVLQSLLCFVR
jgi:hypothetical protein